MATVLPTTMGVGAQSTAFAGSEKGCCPPGGSPWISTISTNTTGLTPAAGDIISSGQTNEPAGLTITTGILEGPGEYWIHAAAKGKDPDSGATGWGPTSDWVSFIALKVELDIAGTADEADDVVCVNGSVNVKARLMGPAGVSVPVAFSTVPSTQAAVSPASTNMTVGTDFDLTLTGLQASGAANDTFLIATIGECECATEDFTVCKVEIKDGEDETKDPGKFACVGKTIKFQAKITPALSGKFDWKITEGHKRVEIEGADNTKVVTNKCLEASKKLDDVKIMLKFKPDGAADWCSPVFHEFTVLKVESITVTPKGWPAGEPLPEVVSIGAGAIASDAHQADVVIRVLPELAGIPVPIQLIDGRGYESGKDARLTMGAVTVIGGGDAMTVQTAAGGIIESVLTSSDVINDCTIQACMKEHFVDFTWDDYEEEEEWTLDPVYLPVPGILTNHLTLRHHRKGAVSKEEPWQPFNDHQIRFFVEKVEYWEDDQMKAATNTPENPGDLCDWAHFPETPYITDADGKVTALLTVEEQPNLWSVTMVAYDWSVYKEPSEPMRPLGVLKFTPMRAGGQPDERDKHANKNSKGEEIKVDLAIEGVSQVEEDGLGGLLPVNLHFDEQNRQSSVDPYKQVLRPDNEPHLVTTHRIIGTDTDLRKVTITIIGANLKGKWKLEYDTSQIKFWKLKSGSYTEVLSNQESEEIMPPYTLQLIAEGISGADPANIKLVFTTSEAGVSCDDDVKLRIFEYWMQEVTNAPGSLPIVNPCGVGLNKTAKFKLTRLTQSIVTPNEITWSISSGASHAQISGSNHGQEVTVNGVSSGDFTIKATWKDFEETLNAKVVEAKQVDLSIVIVCTDNGYNPPYLASRPGEGWTLSASADTINSDVNRANDIFKQWNISFNIKKLVYYVFNSYSWQLYEMVAQKRAYELIQAYDPDGRANDTVEIFYFKDFFSNMGEEQLAGISTIKGIALGRDSCTPNVLAHEIDHTLRKNGQPSHQPEYIECLMFPKDGAMHWDIRLLEAVNFTNFHSDW